MNKFTVLNIVFTFIAMIFAMVACGLPKWFSTDAYGFTDNIIPVPFLLTENFGPFRVCFDANTAGPVPYLGGGVGCHFMDRKCGGLDSNLCGLVNASRAFLIIGILTCVGTIVVLSMSFCLKTAPATTKFVMYIISLVVNGVCFVCFLISFAIAADISVKRHKQIVKEVGTNGVVSSTVVSASFYLTLVGAILLLAGIIITVLKRRPAALSNDLANQEVPLATVNSEYSTVANSTYSTFEYR
jgi:hypothetical protein